MESDSGSVGATLARSQGLLWLLVFTLLGWGLASIVQLRPEPPKLLFASRAADARIECYGQSEVGIDLVSRLDTEFDAGRMVLTVPVLDNKGDEIDAHLRLAVALDLRVRGPGGEEKFRRLRSKLHDARETPAEKREHEEPQ